METEIREYLKQSWGWIVLRGVVAVLFGVLALARPGITLAALVLMWGGYAVADGVVALVTGVRQRGRGNPLWPWLLAGILGIVTGVLTFLVPGITALALLMVIATWAIIVGVLQISAAIRLRKVIEGEWALGLSGVLSVIFGMLVVIHPGAGALGVLWIIAIYSIAFGFSLMVLGFRLRSFGVQKLAHA